MKKILLMLLGVLIALPAMAFQFSYPYEGNTLIYETDGSTCTVVGQNNVTGDLIIPEKALYTYVDPDGNEQVIEYTVVAVGDGVFKHCSLEVVYLPPSIEMIGNNAFPRISELLLIGSPNISYQQDSFESNSHCDTYCPNGLVWDVEQFFSAKVIHYDATDVSYKNGILFTHNSTRIEVIRKQTDEYFEIPEGVEVISTLAFDRNHPEKFIYNGITKIKIPASLKHIEANAFLGMSISEVDIADWDEWYNNVQLDNLYSNPYYACNPTVNGKTVTTVEFTKDMTEIPDYKNLNLYYKNEVKIPSSVKRIGAYAFYNNKELYHVFLPDELEEIGEKAFAGCELLEDVKFPASLKKIEANAYRGCSSLTEIILPEGLSELGWGSFYACKNLEKAVLVADIDSIGSDMFSLCISLNKLYLPLNLRHIGDRAFGRCNSLDEISFPATLETIGESAFDGNYFSPDGISVSTTGSLTKLVIPDNVTSIGKNAFEDQSITNLTLGNGLTEIPEYAFNFNPLNIIKFSEGIEKIGSYAFGWSKASQVILPSSLKEIGENAFYNCKIQELVIPDGVEVLPSGSCGKPSTLVLGSKVDEIAANAFSFENLITLRVKADVPPTLTDAFPITNDQNDALTVVVNKDRSPYYKVDARWREFDNIIEEGKSEFEVYLDGSTSLALEIRLQTGLMPAQVTKLIVHGPLSAADLVTIKENMVSLRSLDLSKVTNLTEIPDSQFEGSLLTEVILPKGIESIGNNAFSDCALLRMSELPASLKTIGSYAFRDCVGVTIYRIPKSVESIADGAFQGCTSLTEILFTGDVSQLKSIGIYAFSGCKLLEYVNLGATNITDINSYAFYGCTELDQIVLPNSVAKIGDNAFRGTAIRDLSFLPVGVTEIGNCAFANCRRLVAANLPEGIKDVAQNLFENCPRLLTVSMSENTETVSTNVLQGSKKLSNISCAAQTAPTAASGAFNDIRLRYVTLTIPQHSFESYLMAAQWGKFETIMNRIPIKIDDGVKVTHVSEDEYQEMLYEDYLEELQAQAQQQADPASAPALRARSARRAAARATTSTSFAPVFDGAQLSTGSDGSGTRIFFHPEEGKKVSSVMFNNEELVDQLENNSLVLPAGSKGNLEISTAPSSGMSGVADVTEDSSYEETTAPIYNLTGVIVGYGKAAIRGLQPGIYVFCGKKIAVK